jgi:tetratricopeptide (TPR) repeat protein
MHNETYKQIKLLCTEGDELADQEDYPAALKKFWDAFDLIPEPKTDWEAATWVLAAIGDVNFLNKDYQAGVDNLHTAMHCPNAIGNPFIHLRLGQCLFELQLLEQAANEFTRAYAIDGENIFKGDDPKYFQFLKTRISI